MARPRFIGPCVAGMLATVDLLLKAGAKASTANRYGVTPLYLASANGDASTVARLLEAGADPNTRSP